MEARVNSQRKYDPLITFDDLNEKVGQEIFLLVQKVPTGLDYVGCESIKELGDYIAELTTIMPGYPALLIRGEIRDPENLPFEADYGDEIFVMHKSLSLRRFNSMRQVTVLVESMMHSASTITEGLDTFVILTGRALPQATIDSLFTRVNLLRRMAST